MSLPYNDFITKRIHSSKKFPLIMGILNVTPDSFSDGGDYFAEEKAIEHAIEMFDQGADIIDIGGESTRPGSERVPLEKELQRTIPIIKTLSEEISIPISIDTYKAAVAEKALENGATIVNDISGMTFSEDIAGVVSDYECPVIISHIKGTPKNMQKNPHYDNCLQEIKNYFQERLDYAREQGIQPKKIVLDPGIGFGKRLVDNLALIRDIDFFYNLEKPMLVGTSRKSFIGEILDEDNPKKRLYGSLATFAYLALKNIDILRVHDVKPARELLEVLAQINNKEK